MLSSSPTASPRKETSTSHSDFTWCINTLFWFVWPKFGVWKLAWDTADTQGEFIPMKFPFSLLSQHTWFDNNYCIKVHTQEYKSFGAPPKFLKSTWTEEGDEGNQGLSSQATVVHWRLPDSVEGIKRKTSHGLTTIEKMFVMSRNCIPQGIHLCSFKTG